NAQLLNMKFKCLVFKLKKKKYHTQKKLGRHSLTVYIENTWWRSSYYQHLLNVVTEVETVND
ncbi:hypothetical protein ACQP3L_36715, partial [Escherichia coli]